MSTRFALPLPFRLTRRAFVEALGSLLALELVCPSRSSVAFAEDAPPFRVIAHPENPARSIDREVLAKMFLKEVTRWDDGEAVHPVDLRGDSEVRSKFCDAIIRRSLAAVRSYWQQRIFSGRGVPPPEVESDAEAVRYVLKYRGSVGYVSAHADIGKAKTLTVNY